MWSFICGVLASLAIPLSLERFLPEIYDSRWVAKNVSIQREAGFQVGRFCVMLVLYLLPIVAVEG